MKGVVQYGHMGPRNELDEQGVKHYWGDATRQLLVVAAVIIMIASPFYVGIFGPSLLLNVIAVLVIVAFAALTNPFKRWVIMGDAVIAGIGVAIFGGSAILTYQSTGFVDAAASLGLGLVFLAAFYFAMKTLRAMLLEQVETDESSDDDRGSRDERWERSDDDTPTEDYDGGDGRAFHPRHESLEDREDDELMRHGGHMPVGDITDEAPKEDFSD